MRPHQLKALIAVAEYGSIRAAARSVYLSQAALTKAIKELEDDMGTSLVMRTTLGVQLTEAGKALYTHALAIVAELRGAREDIERVKGGSSGKVVAAVSPVASTALLARAYRAFRQRLPDMRVDFSEGNLLHSAARLREGSLDFLVVGALESEPTDEFCTTPLFQDEIVLMCRRGHPLADAQSMTALRECEWILYSASPEFADDMIDAWAEEGIVLPRRPVRCASLTPIMALVTEMDAIVAMPTRVLDAPWLRDALTRIPVRERLPTLTVTLFTRKTSPLSPHALFMIECFREAAREEPGLGRDGLAEALDEKVDEGAHRRR